MGQFHTCETEPYPIYGAWTVRTMLCLLSPHRVADCLHNGTLRRKWLLRCGSVELHVLIVVERGAFESRRCIFLRSKIILTPLGLTEFEIRRCCERQRRLILIPGYVWDISTASYELYLLP